MQTKTTTKYRVAIGQHRVDTGARVSGCTRIVEADSREEAAAMAVAHAREADSKSVERHNRDAERFGTWTVRHGMWDFQVEGVRKAPVRR